MQSRESSELKICAFIPVRGGSKSIPLKNIKPFAGKPLVYWVVRAAVDCSEITEVYVSTDNERIRQTVSEFHFPKVTVIGRSKESASDTASTEYAMLEFANVCLFDYIVLIQATSPFLKAQDLSKGIALLNEADSVLSVVRQKRFVWKQDVFAQPLNYDYRNRPRRQDFDGFLVENGAFYITSRDGLMHTGCRLSGRIKTVEMPEASYHEIDEISDWVAAEALFFLIKERGDCTMDLENYLECKANSIKDSFINVMKEKNAYYREFITTLEKFNKILSNKKIKRMVDKFNLDKKYDEECYAQHACELSVLKYILEKFNDNFKYEPTYNTRKNPECAFEYKGKTINIEVKCPNYRKRKCQLSRPGIKVMTPERYFEKIKIDEINQLQDIQVLDLLDNKLKSFFQDAHVEFPDSDDQFFNILFIALPDIYAMDEWYIYLFGCRGVFSDNPAINVDFSNIHAIVLSDIRKNHEISSVNFCGTWGFENTINLFIPNPHMDSSNDSAREFYWNKALDMFGNFTRKYHDYVSKMERISEADWEKVQKQEMSLDEYNGIHQTRKCCMLSSVMNGN